jgi:hypothetical protein
MGYGGNMKVKCIDAEGKGIGHLVEGNIYDVIVNDTTTRIYELDGLPGVWNRARFVIIDEDRPTLPCSTNAAPKPDDVDHEEERAWLMFRPSVANGNCVCDIPRDKCWIHHDR